MLCYHNKYCERGAACVCCDEHILVAAASTPACALDLILPHFLPPHPPSSPPLPQTLPQPPLAFLRVLAKMTDWVMARVSYRSHSVSSFQSSFSTFT